MEFLFIYRGPTAPGGPGPPHYRGFTIILRHTTFGRIPLDERSARHQDLHLTAHNTHKTNIHAPGGIRTRNPSKRAKHAFDCAAAGIGSCVWKVCLTIRYRSNTNRTIHIKLCTVVPKICWYVYSSCIMLSFLHLKF